MESYYEDRSDAGRRLARHLSEYAGDPDVIVLGLPRGGVPVAYEVAKELCAPLDLFVVRKLGVPGEEEMAMGAIASGGLRVLNDPVIRYFGIGNADIDAVARREVAEIERREKLYRGHRKPLEVRGKTVILVDDGLATGSTMLAAVAALRLKRPSRIIVAVPVAAASTCSELDRVADRCICASTPPNFRAVGMWYHDFSQVADDEVRDILDRAMPIPSQKKKEESKKRDDYRKAL